MSSRTLASKYARTVFDTVPDADRARVADDLDAFAALVASHDELKATFRNPAVPFERKSAIASAIASQAGAHQTVATIVGLLGTHDQLHMVADLAHAFRLRLNQHLRIVDARVKTAVPLTSGQADALRQGLSEATGLQVRLTSASIRRSSAASWRRLAAPSTTAACRGNWRGCAPPWCTRPSDSLIPVRLPKSRSTRRTPDEHQD